MQTISVAKDQLVLYHRGIAMNRMRQLLSDPHHNSQVELCFTIARMLSITVSLHPDLSFPALTVSQYMSNEPASFQVHLQAFKRIAGEYIAANPDSDLAAVIQNRLGR